MQGGIALPVEESQALLVDGEKGRLGESYEILRLLIHDALGIATGHPGSADSLDEDVILFSQLVAGEIGVAAAVALNATAGCDPERYFPLRVGVEFLADEGVGFQVPLECDQLFG